MRSTCIGMC
ncbi:uncharacterized protein FFNC_00030 [Fusarium fujikuroi]|nr:uncharacterized protein FFC1_00031 [Fusarium fujikuroi]SCO27930.1 uncharacterized protein FFNC_00030 [Fusarium fujikuroi]